MAFPATLDDLDATRGTANDKLSSPSHVTHHTAEDTIIEALQTKVGIDSSADTTSLDYKLKSTSSSNPGHKHTLANGATDVTATAAELNYNSGVTSAVQTQINTKQTRSVLTTKGDFYVATASDTVTRMPAGTNGYVLVADSTQTNGLRYAEVITKFGGTGADGALSSSSGTTTLNAAGAQVLVKNYTSISLTGTAVLTISNPHANGTILILKSQGAVTITSSTNPAIDMRSMGGTGGAGGSSLSQAGTDGSRGLGFLHNSYQGLGGLGTSTGVGTGGAALLPLGFFIWSKAVPMVVGAGAGGGGAGTVGANFGPGGAGGRGGGSVFIECGGALNITSTINCAGTAGTAGTLGGAGSNSGAGGGGGGGGVICILYATLTANTGTYTVTGGTGGTGGAQTGNGGNGGDGGGGGGSFVNAGADGTVNINDGGGAGGAGGAGSSLIASNSEFV